MTDQLWQWPRQAVAQADAAGEGQQDGRSQAPPEKTQGPGLGLAAPLAAAEGDHGGGRSLSLIGGVALAGA